MHSLRTVRQSIIQIKLSNLVLRPLQLRHHTTLLVASLLVFPISFATASPSITQPNDVDFVSKFSLPVQIVSPKNQSQSQESTDDTASAPLTAISPNATTYTPTEQASSPPSPSPSTKPYQSLRQKNIWEKLKTKPTNKDASSPNNDGDDLNNIEQSNSNNQTTTQPKTRLNIYK